MIEVLISSPIYDRAWILPDWFAAIEKQDFPLSLIGFQFEAAPNDDETIQELLNFYDRHPEVQCFDININTKEEHVSHKEGERRWRRDRYAIMANFRNNLLARARCRQPNRYLSLDTDMILEDPTTISQLYGLTIERAGVAPLAFMTPFEIEFPNVMSWGGDGRGYRTGNYPFGKLFQSDIIMAVVMMNINLYQQVNYNYHPQGEDLGWSWDARMKGFTLHSASNIYVSHQMSRASLVNYRINGDPRKELLKEKVST